MTLLESFDKNPHMWNGFAGAEGWGAGHPPYFYAKEFTGDEGADGLVLVVTKNGIEVHMNTWNGEEASDWYFRPELPMGAMLALAEGLSQYLFYIDNRTDVEALLGSCGFNLF